MLSQLAARRLSERPDLAALAQAAETEARPRQSRWGAEGGVYVNRETGRAYQPHHDDERQFVFSDTPRRVLAKGGEGGGKSVAGIVKGLERLRRGCSGIMGSPDFEHFKRSLWPEFRRWCPWDSVVARHQHRASTEWEPNKPFTLVFETPGGHRPTLFCGGFDDPAGWEGPNVNWSLFDEARRHKEPKMLKVLDGRCRLLGPADEPPQLIFATTPRKHWLWEYFGPLQPDDPLASFKAETFVIDLFTIDNERMGNLAAGFTEQRRQSLGEAEARVLLEAAWEDIDDVDRLLPNMLLWDLCREELLPLSRHEPMVLSLDAAKGRKTAASDCFAITGITRHPQRRNDVAVRFFQVWQAKAGQVIDYQGTEEEPGPERVVRDLCRQLNVVQVVYDPYQLHDMAQRLDRDGVVWCEEFDQGPRRAQADAQLVDLITQRRLAHDGDPTLRSHIDNADRKLDAESRKIRIVKRSGDLKIDGAVCCSMGAAACLELNL